MTIFDYAVLNGQLGPKDQAQINITNGALFSSFGVYETMKIEAGRPFYLEEHMRRLLDSADMLGMDLGVDVAALLTWFNALADVDRRATWNVRILALGAVQPDDTPMIAMWPQRPPTYPDDLHRTGAAAILYEGQRALPACKSLNTLVNFLARRAGTQTGALEGILHHNGHLTEGARSNIFAVRGGNLITPPVADVLSGITRDVILQVMQNTDYPVVETPLPADPALYDEFFISSTSMHVMPITQIDGRPLGNGTVGPITKIAMARFDTHYRQMMTPTSR